MLRALRIAVSVVSGICCVLMIVLWVRSYTWWDSYGYRLRPNRGVALNSFAGKTVVTVFNHGNGYWTYEARKLANGAPSLIHPVPRVGVGLAVDARGTSAFVPHWMMGLLMALSCGVPWLRYRFSLKALLLATTAVALLLALIIYAARG